MKRYWIIILIVLILAIASFFRLWNLNSIPPGVYPDEAMNGNDAINALQTNEYKTFYPDNNGREGLYINLIAFSFKVFGVHIWSLKLIGALIGILTVLGLYFLTNELLRSHYIALIATFFLAISFWHVNFSRIGFRAILAVLLLVWSIYLLFKAMNIRNHNKKSTKLSVICCLLSGFFFGLGFHTYIAFRIAVVLLVIPFVMICIRFWKEYKANGKFWSTYFKKGFWQYAFWIVMMIIAALPIGMYFLQNPQDFMGRASGVSVLALENPLKALAESAYKTLGMFNVAGDFNWRHNFAGSPQFLWPVGIFFLIGLIISIKEFIKSIKEKTGSRFMVHSSLLIWFGAMLLPAILTYEGLPHALRSLCVIPVCYIFAAMGAYAVYKFLYKFIKSQEVNKALFLAVCFLFLFSLGYVQYDKYFSDWARQPDVQGAFAKDFVEIGKYLNSLDPPATAPMMAQDIKRYVIVNQDGVLIPVEQNGKIRNIPMPAQTVIFIERTSQPTWYKLKTIYLLPDEIDKIKKPTNAKLVVIPLQYDHEIFKALEKKFPEGKTRFQESFWLFEI